MTFSSHVSLGSSWLWHFLRIPLFFLMYLTILRSTGQIYCRIPLYWNSSDLFLVMRPESWVLQRKTTKINAICVTSYQEYILSTWFSVFMLILLTLCQHWTFYYIICRTHKECMCVCLYIHMCEWWWNDHLWCPFPQGLIILFCISTGIKKCF